MRVVHYLNQFFAGIGGEEMAGLPLEIREGAVGPGKLLEQLFAGDAKIIRTVICGDNYAVERQDEVVAAVVEMVRAAKADLFIAGPCYRAGRYGMASGALSVAVQSKLGIPAITAMSEENPGADLYREALYIVDSGPSPAKMRDVLARVAKLGKKLVQNQAIGLPAEEGYLRRGLLRDQFVEKTAASRLVDMVMAKIKGEPFESEMVSTFFEPIPMPPPVIDISKAKVMVITDGGLVPKGNPDKIEGTAATRWGAYSVEEFEDLKGEDWEISHGGYDPRFVQQDPDRLVPLDALRALEKEGMIGALHNEFLSTSGLSNPLSNTRRIGREMAEKVKREAVDAVILTST
ncbi:MAG: glycine/betaine/sarcosine/D-proline family reductase selenoprotein B [Deltaproteobacteria bacterium]|nr:glycine/betaine/sarcosine/D-proline family reductase selenoprotein B [Deltaproteobacteria bacterium]